MQGETSVLLLVIAFVTDRRKSRQWQKYILSNALRQYKLVFDLTRIPSGRYPIFIMPPISKTSTELLLQAAQTVILRDGILHMTLDAVAREAGVSKGGLLHYYPNKNALLEGMTSALLETFEAEIEQRMAADPVEQGRFCRAYVAVTLMQETREELALSSALLAAATTVEPQLLMVVRDRYAHWKARALADGMDTDTAALVFFAADGFWFARMLGLGNTEDAAPLARAVSRLMEAATSGQ